MSLLTTLGVGSLAVGLAAKETLSNMISGFTLIIDRNFTHGDRINLGGLIGDVEEIGLRSTRLRVPDGNMIIVPNSELVNSKILNLSVPSREVACSTDVRLDLEVSFEKAREAALNVLKSLSQQKRILNERSQKVFLRSLGQGYQSVSIHFWVADFEDATAVTSEVNERLLVSFREAGITLAGPQGAIFSSGDAPK